MAESGEPAIYKCSVLPLSSVRLLVPPLRLMSAFMWKVVQEQKLEHFNKLEEYIQLITKMVPEILTISQKTTLIMGLRAKMILEMCKHEVSTDLKTVKACLQTAEPSNRATGTEMEALHGKLLKLVLSLLEDPVKKRHFFQEIFPIEYGPDFDKALQVLVGHFLSRLEQLLPVPNFKQASIWLSTESTDWEDLVPSDWDHSYLMPLFQNDYQGTLERSGLPSIVEDRIISSLSLAPLTDLILSDENKTDDLSQSSLCIARSCLRNQDVSQESERASQPLQCFSLSQAEVRNKAVDIEDPDLPKYSTHEEWSLNETGVEQSQVCETREEMLQASESESESNTDRLEERIDPNTVKILNSGLKNVGERTDVTNGELTSAPVTSTGQLLKVVVPRELIPIVKQICLPSVLLTCCSSNGPIPLTTVSDDSSSNSIIDSSDSGNGCKDVSRALERRQHECSQCGMSFRYPGELRAHNQKHTARGPYKCLPCKMNFKTYFQASVHQRQWHSDVTYSCPSCDKSFKSMRAWSKHHREHQEKTVYRCTDCGKECTSLTSLVIHSKLHNHLMSGSFPSQMYRCTVCGDTFSERANLTGHMKTHEVNRQETSTDPAQVVPPAKCQSGQCRFCGQMFSEIELRSHLKTHPEFRPHQCDHCGKCLATLPGLLAHISNHTGDKPYICASCGKRFFSRSQLNTHMKSHSKEQSFCCSYCGKCFFSAGNLNIHVRMHTGEKPYVCAECGKAFKSAGCLQVHRRCHTGEKPYKCTVCGKGFTVSSHRTVHMRGHTGVRPFACDICGKTFVRKSCWNEHLYSHSGIRPFTCSVCSKSFMRRAHLKRHMQCHSGDCSDAVI